MSAPNHRKILVVFSLAVLAGIGRARAIERLNLKSPTMNGFATAYINVGGGMYHHERVPVEVTVFDEFVNGGERARAKSVSMHFPAGEFQFESKSTFELVTRSYEIGVSYAEIDLEYREIDWAYLGQNNGDIVLMTNAILREPATPDFTWTIRDLTDGPVGEGASSIEAASVFELRQNLTNVDFPHSATLDFEYFYHRMGSYFSIDQTIGVHPFATGWFSIEHPGDFSPVPVSLSVPEPSAAAIAALGLAFAAAVASVARQRANS